MNGENYFCYIYLLPYLFDYQLFHETNHMKHIDKY